MDDQNLDKLFQPLEEYEDLGAPDAGWAGLQPRLSSLSVGKVFLLQRWLIAATVGLVGLVGINFWLWQRLDQQETQLSQWQEMAEAARPLPLELPNDSLLSSPVTIAPKAGVVPDANLTRAEIASSPSVGQQANRPLSEVPGKKKLLDDQVQLIADQLEQAGDRQVFRLDVLPSMDHLIENSLTQPRAPLALLGEEKLAKPLEAERIHRSGPSIRIGGTLATGRLLLNGEKNHSYRGYGGSVALEVKQSWWLQTGIQQISQTYEIRGARLQNDLFLRRFPELVRSDQPGQVKGIRMEGQAIEIPLLVQKRFRTNQSIQPYVQLGWVGRWWGKQRFWYEYETASGPVGFRREPQRRGKTVNSSALLGAGVHLALASSWELQAGVSWAADWKPQGQEQFQRKQTGLNLGLSYGFGG